MSTTKIDLPLICPADHSILEAKPALVAYQCTHCRKIYPIKDGVVCMLETPDEFYEGHYGNQTRFVPKSEKPWHVWPLWLINSGYLWSVRKQVPAGATVIELGCAGGVRYFGDRYRVVGCDLSLAGLQAVNFYEQRVQADAASCIALPDASVDAVVSSYFWEHIPPELKPGILRQCLRVLRPGGKIIFLYDVETDNPLIRPYKLSQANIYKRLFIDGDGHLGYETPAANRAYFEAVGLKVLAQNGMEKTHLQSASVYFKLATFKEGRLLKFLGTLGGTRMFYPWTLMMRLVDTGICPLLPARWARIEMMIAEKR